MVTMHDYLRLLAPMPMPYLLLQLGVGLAWIVFIVLSVRRWGRQGLWTLCTAPVAIFGWGLASVVAVVVACVVGDGCL